jgi:hypothetical protein
MKRRLPKTLWMLATAVAVTGTLGRLDQSLSRELSTLGRAPAAAPHVISRIAPPRMHEFAREPVKGPKGRSGSESTAEALPHAQFFAPENRSGQPKARDLEMMGNAGYLKRIDAVIGEENAIAEAAAGRAIAAPRVSADGVLVLLKDSTTGNTRLLNFAENWEFVEGENRRIAPPDSIQSFGKITLDASVRAILIRSDSDLVNPPAQALAEKLQQELEAQGVEATQLVLDHPRAVIYRPELNRIESMSRDLGNGRAGKITDYEVSNF